MSDLFRSWKWRPSPGGNDPELLRLEQQAQQLRVKLSTMREHGRQVRAHRLESLDALETRRMTLEEIHKRMEKELADKNVDDYADVLAEVFGDRVIYAHRAVGLEALLCQFMHQMLAKQHQLKILKQTGKDLQKLYQVRRSSYRDEFHSFEALTVQVEAMRLSLEAQYDDIFAAQHSLLARFHHVEAGGTMTNYKIVKPEGDGKGKQKSNSTGDSAADKGGARHSQAGEEFQDVDISDKPMRKSAPPNAMFFKSPLTTMTNNNSGSQMSARSRRREIEQKRLASGRGLPRGKSFDDSQNKKNARDKLRVLEANRPTFDLITPDSNGSKLQAGNPLNFSRSDGDMAASLKKPRAGGIIHEDDPTRARREKRRSERAAARAAPTVA
jgi:hypothetical protein